MSPLSLSICVYILLGTLLLEAYSEMKGIPPIVYTAKSKEKVHLHLQDWPVHNETAFQGLVDSMCSEWTEEVSNRAAASALQGGGTWVPDDEDDLSDDEVGDEIDSEFEDDGINEAGMEEYFKVLGSSGGAGGDGPETDPMQEAPLPLLSKLFYISSRFRMMLSVSYHFCSLLLLLVGSDISPRAIDATKHNLQVGDVTESDAAIIQGDFAKVFNVMKLRSGGRPLGIQIVTHVPYGLSQRGSDDSDKSVTTSQSKGGDEAATSSHSKGATSTALTKTFRRFGSMLSRNRSDFGDVFVLTASQSKTHFINATNLKWETVMQFQNQGIRVSLLKWDDAMDSRVEEVRKTLKAPKTLKTKGEGVVGKKRPAFAVTKAKSTNPKHLFYERVIKDH